MRSGSALRSVACGGDRPRYRIVEDGDRAGNYSTKGVEAKKRAKLTPWKLPPRSPSLMPMDYSIWARIMTDVIENAPAATETKAAFKARLHAAATSLPRGYVRSVIRRMRENLQALVSAKGYLPKND